MDTNLSDLDEGNRLIAEYLNGKDSLHYDSGVLSMTSILFTKNGSEGFSYPVPDYSAEVKWLMPACRKFRMELSDLNYIIAQMIIDEIEELLLKYFRGEAELIDIFNALVEGIKWLNENKK